MTTTSTTITVELSDAQCTALLKLLPEPNPRGTAVKQLSYKVRRAIDDAERGRAFLRGDKYLQSTKHETLGLRDCKAIKEHINTIEM